MIELPYDPSDGDSVLLARHRYANIRYAIPERLEHAARLVRDAIQHTCGYDLTEALGHSRDLYDFVADDLMTAARRIRIAAEHIPEPGTSEGLR